MSETQTHIEEIEKLMSDFLKQPGEPDKRDSYKFVKDKLGKIGLSCEVFCDFLRPDNCLVAIYCLTEPESEKRARLLKQALGELLKKSIPEHTMRFLSYFSSSDLKNSVHSCIYLNDCRGSRASYVAAKLSLHLTKEAFGFFLEAREWSRQDLLNLALLVLEDEREELAEILDQRMNLNLSQRLSSIFQEFSYIVAQKLALEPSLSDVDEMEFKKPNYSRVESITCKESIDQPLKRECPPPVKTTDYGTDSQGNKYFHGFFYFYVSGFVLLSAIFFLTLPYTAIESSPIYEAPESWQDASTGRETTQDYLLADRKYRKGEIYLTRDMYTEAIAMFNYAYYIDSGHLAALFRLGYCYLMVQEYNVASKKFERLLEIDSRYPQANLFLARVAVRQNDFEKAIKYYKKEVKISVNPNAGLEYVAFLEEQGNLNKAADVIVELQKRFSSNQLMTSSGMLRKPEYGRLE